MKCPVLQRIASGELEMNPPHDAGHNQVGAWRQAIVSSAAVVTGFQASRRFGSLDR